MVEEIRVFLSMIFHQSCHAMVTGNEYGKVISFINDVCKTFKCSDISNLRYFLGLDCIIKGDSLILFQQNYIKEVLKKHGYKNARPTKIPMLLSIKLTPEMGDCLPDATIYKSMVGLLHHVTLTRPHLSYPIRQICQYLYNLKKGLLMVVKRIFRYLRGIENLGLRITKNPNVVKHSSGIQEINYRI